MTKTTCHVQEVIHLGDREILEVVNHLDTSMSAASTQGGPGATDPRVLLLRKDERCSRCSSASSDHSQSSTKSTDSSTSTCSSSCSSKDNSKAHRKVHFDDRNIKSTSDKKDQLDTGKLLVTRKQETSKVKTTQRRKLKGKKAEQEEINAERVGTLLISASRKGWTRDYTNSKSSQKTEVAHPLARAALARARDR